MAAKVPVELRAKYVSEMEVGDSGWLRTFSLVAGDDWTLHTWSEAVVYPKRVTKSCLLEKTVNGLRITWDSGVWSDDDNDLASKSFVRDPEELKMSEDDYVNIDEFVMSESEDEVRYKVGVQIPDDMPY